MRIITWNTQGERLEAVKQRLRDFKPDVMVVQECGNLPSKLRYPLPPPLVAQSLGLVEDYQCWFCLWDRQQGDGNLRCSMAMFLKNRVQNLRVVEAVDREKRPAIMTIVNTHYAVCNIHAGGLAYIQAAIQSTCNYGYDKGVVVIGDFNQDPRVMQSEIMPSFPQLSITHPEIQTHEHGKILDYAVSNMQGVAQRLEKYGSDHWPVMIDFQ